MDDILDIDDEQTVEGDGLNGNAEFGGIFVRNCGNTGSPMRGRGSSFSANRRRI